MRFEWDQKKNRDNQRKHKISFELAREVFLDPFCFIVRDRVVEDEQRFWTVGSVGGVVVLVVAHTAREEGEEEVIRIISARKATPRERHFYETNEIPDYD
ncbi:MAG TPA: BrnT family toxin [Terriglobales bacterium]|nr:BrnT family toxin [Terriglobales bacterium]